MQINWSSATLQAYTYRKSKLILVQCHLGAGVEPCAAGFLREMLYKTEHDDALVIVCPILNVLWELVVRGKSTKNMLAGKICIQIVEV